MTDEHSAMKDYAATASHLSHIASEYGAESWTSMEINLLKTYAACLKMLNRRDDHVRILLTILAKKVKETSSHTASITSRGTGRFAHTRAQIQPKSAAPQQSVQDALEDVKVAARQLPYDLTLPLVEYFDQIVPDTHITLFDDRDGFKLGVTLSQHLAERLQIDEITIQLINTQDSHESELTLQSTEALQVGHGMEHVWLTSKVR